MNKYLIISLLSLAAYGCRTSITVEPRVKSPDGRISVYVWLDKGEPYYSASFRGTEIIRPSLLGMVLADGDTLTSNLSIAGESVTSHDETWEQAWGEQRYVRDHHNEYILELEEASGRERHLQIVFRVFDDGFGFRYVVPEQPGLGEFTIMDELTEFVMAGNHEAWWIPAYRDNRYEYLYTKSPVNDLDTVHTPLTMEAKNGLCLSIHEADLTDYASMQLASVGNNTLKCDLAPWSDGTKVKTRTPMRSPWRTVQVAEDPGSLVASRMILNLNEPCRLTDLSWVHPGKYLGIWWAMHTGKYTFWEGPDHGASTAHSIEYIDNCRKLGIDNLLIEGWNTGWTPTWYENRLHKFNFTECANDFDFSAVSEYARRNHVNLIGYHETGSNIDNYLPQMDAGMKMYQDAGMHAIKIGQVGSRLMMKEWHYGQYGVNYYRKVLERAADYQLMVIFHEPVKPTGLQRTFPHYMACEGARGQEYNAWSEGNPPEHTVILPFTRLLGGPLDFTPGIFAIKNTHVHTTLAKQLALYVTIYSPMQMLADLPENYIGNPAFKFLKDVPVNWDTTCVIHARIGDYYTVVRKDRDSEDWYLGSITDEEAREFTITLTFLPEGRKYRAEIYADADDAAYDLNPEACTISEMDADSHTSLTLRLARGGGQAIRFAAIPPGR
jgi:alpha-glucosidase